MDGVTVRAVRLDDYRDIYDIMACPGVVRNTMQLPYVSLDRRKSWLENMGPGDHSLVAEVDGRVVGNIGLHRKTERLAHVAGLGMSVHDDFQGKGIGTAMMQAVLDLADNWLNLKRVELTVYVDNLRAVGLYERCGFAIEGTHKAFAFREGEYVDAHFMARVR